jgi:hypothetical protein
VGCNYFGVGRPVAAEIQAVASAAGPIDYVIIEEERHSTIIPQALRPLAVGRLPVRAHRTIQSSKYQLICVS